MNSLSEQIVKDLSKDINNAFTDNMTRQEAKFLVTRYYQSQKNRKQVDGQIRALAGSEKQYDVLLRLSSTYAGIEKIIKHALDFWTDKQPVSVWAKSIHGVGAIIAAGFETQIDIEKCPSAGHIWSYAGLEPGQKRENGVKINWNPQLKALCWNLGEVFQKSKSHKSFYRQLYDKRKAYESAKNERLEYSSQAKHALATRNLDKNKIAYKCYSVGKLPPGHINERVKRYVVKMFISQWHEVAYKERYGKAPPAPYIFVKDPGNHIHLITPNMVF